MDKDNSGKPVKPRQPLKPSQLRPDFTRAANAAGAGREKTRDYIVGQTRAVDALKLAVQTGNSGFNAFVSGNPGFGRHALVRKIAREEASRRSSPSDWVYLNNFDEPDKPFALELPSGMARRFKSAMEELIDDLANELPARFEGDEYLNQRKAMELEVAEAHEQSFNSLVELAESKSLVLLRTPMGFVVAAQKEGKPISPEAFKELPKAQQKQIDEDISVVQSELETVLKAVPRRQKEHRRAVEKLNAEMAKQSVDVSVDEIQDRFGSISGISEFLQRVRRDLIENAELFLVDDSEGEGGPFPVATAKHYLKPRFRRYTVNAVVAHSDPADHGAPVVEEKLPTLANLIGRVEHESRMGALMTDFTLIRPGALHRANGGFLVLDAGQLLREPMAWDALKRCLQTGQVSIVPIQERLSVITTRSLDPDPIPLNVRIILIGERILYYLLSALDSDFPELFKLQADFDDDIVAKKQAVTRFVAALQAQGHAEGLMPIDRPASAELALEASRMAADSQKLSLNQSALLSIVKEAELHTMRRGGKSISRADIIAARDEKEHRGGRFRDQILDSFKRNIIMLETSGQASGQVNALSVSGIGDLRIGRPSRITATVRAGRGKLVDIEREVELGGPLHSKGVMILSAYLASNYALSFPLSLSASIVFEQSYGGVDGDSASAAELFCLLSAIANVPIYQHFAVTGSVNQKGMIQAIGGVNEKIEGFFDVCVAHGLSSKQGVLIPAANVQHLVLRDRVVEAVEAGQFRIIPIKTVADGIELLTDCPAGERQTDGRYPEGTFNHRIEQSLTTFAENMKGYFSGAPGSDEPGVS